MVGPLCEAPTIAGTPLQRELAGYWSARRGSYWVIYRLDEDDMQVVVVRLEHRSDVYRQRWSVEVAPSGTAAWPGGTMSGIANTS